MKLKIKSKSVNTSRKSHIFLIFLLSSMLLWFLIKLSKTYEAKVAYNIVYKNMPSSKLFQEVPGSEVMVYIKSSGFKILREKMGHRTMSVSLKNVQYISKYKYFLDTEDIEDDFESQLPNNIEFIGFEEDSLYYFLGYNKHKKIPVKANVELNFRLGYNIDESIQKSVDSIVVSGPESQVNKISYVETETVIIEDVFEDVTIDLNILERDDLNKITYSAQTVTAKASVEKFTEGSFAIPFRVVNLPKDAEITTYPTVVNVVFQVGVSNYKKLNADDFEIVCDYKHSQSTGKNFLVPILLQKPTFIKAVSIAPEQIEFLIKQ